MVWKSSQNQFGRPKNKKRSTKFSKFFLKIPPPLEKFLDPRLNPAQKTFWKNCTKTVPCKALALWSCCYPGTQKQFSENSHNILYIGPCFRRQIVLIYLYCTGVLLAARCCLITAVVLGTFTSLLLLQSGVKCELSAQERVDNGLRIRDEEDFAAIKCLNYFVILISTIQGWYY